MVNLCEDLNKTGAKAASKHSQRSARFGFQPSAQDLPGPRPQVKENAMKSITGSANPRRSLPLNILE